MDVTSNKAAKIIAYYLPQFHPIPENDEWWGPGFTEWTNVGKAKPLFKGHYQPRIPADLGYYDLRIPEVRESQAQLAKEAGIEGFMYWHYWFGNGKRILEMPFNEVVKSGSPDFPFCLGWANHSWRSDSWKNKGVSINTPQLLLEQLYPGVDDFTNHFYALLPAFQDKRYIRYENKPLFVVYSPLEITNCELFIETWNTLAIKNGLDGFHFVGISKGWATEIGKIFDLGFNAVNRNGQWEAECIVKGKLNRIITGKIIESIGGIYMDKYDYAKVVKNMFSDYDKKDNIYPTILSQWDRSARSGRQATVYTNSSPEKFETHLKTALEYVKDKKYEDRIIFLKSWNEWGEGNYVEPDLKYGKAYLNVIKKQLVK
jgi:lipopolysaccharide biosynthesis protein